MSCLAHARYTMTMDVLSQTKTQNESGEIVRNWSTKESDVPCIARGIAGGGIRVVGSIERWSSVYDDVEYVKIQCNYNLSKRDRITNIRTNQGTLAWEDDNIGTTFDIIGASPVMDPFGRLVEYDILATKADIDD